MDKAQFAYDSLMFQAVRKGWPVIFKTDLTQFDRDTLKTDKPEKFIWILRECGTELFQFGLEGKDRAFEIDWARITVNGHPEAVGWLYDHGKMKEIDLKKAFPPLRFPQGTSINY
jgi:hypothetical protein